MKRIFMHKQLRIFGKGAIVIKVYGSTVPEKTDRRIIL